MQVVFVCVCVPACLVGLEQGLVGGISLRGSFEGCWETALKTGGRGAKAKERTASCGICTLRGFGLKWEHKYLFSGYQSRDC